MVEKNMSNIFNALNMIQNVIDRMGANSFALKGWAVTLVAGIFVLSNNEANKDFFLLTYIPIIMFWFLDAFYLQKERQYRNLFNWTRIQPNNSIDFDFNLGKPELKTPETEFGHCLFSVTEIGFYLPLALLTLVIIALSAR